MPSLEHILIALPHKQEGDTAHECVEKRQTHKGDLNYRLEILEERMQDLSDKISDIEKKLKEIWDEWCLRWVISDNLLNIRANTT